MEKLTPQIFNVSLEWLLLKKLILKWSARDPDYQGKWNCLGSFNFLMYGIELNAYFIQKYVFRKK